MCSGNVNEPKWQFSGRWLQIREILQNELYWEVLGEFFFFFFFLMQRRGKFWLLILGSVTTRGCFHGNAIHRHSFSDSSSRPWLFYLFIANLKLADVCSFFLSVATLKDLKLVKDTDGGRIFWTQSFRKTFVTVLCGKSPSFDSNIDCDSILW